MNNEGFQSIADFGVLQDKDVFEMVKRVGNCMVVAGCVNVGAIQVKKLQAPCHWVWINRNMDRVLLRMIGIMTQ
jgi:hypothetical protein